MYDLYVDGLREIQRSQLFRKIRRYREGLSGLTDGSNCLFFTPYQPLLSEATTLIYLSGSLVSSGSYSLDLEAGAVLFGTAPSANIQPEATYYAVDLTTDQLKEVLFRGFQEMESRWQRGYRLSSDASTYAAATGDEDHAYVCAGSTLTDPVTGSKTFSTSLAQRTTYIACCDLALLYMQSQYQAPSAFSWREDRGIAVDKRGVPSNIAEAIELQEKRIARAIQGAQEETYGEGALGGYISNVNTEDYEESFDWLTDRKEELGIE